MTETCAAQSTECLAVRKSGGYRQDVTLNPLSHTAEHGSGSHSWMSWKAAGRPFSLHASLTQPGAGSLPCPNQLPLIQCRPSRTRLQGQRVCQGQRSQEQEQRKGERRDAVLETVQAGGKICWENVNNEGKTQNFVCLFVFVFAFAFAFYCISKNDEHINNE